MHKICISYDHFTFQCTRPAFSGNGVTCGLDSDSDGQPDVQLNCTDKQCNEVCMFVCTHRPRMYVCI